MLTIGTSVAALLLTATAGINTNQIRTDVPISVNLSGVTAAEGSALSVSRSNHTHSISGTLPQANGGTGAGALTCSAGQHLTSNGTVYSCSADSGGAGTGLSFLTATSEATLSNETNLGALTTGLLKHTVTAGTSVPATASAGTDYGPPTSGNATGLVLSTTGTGAHTAYGGTTAGANQWINAISTSGVGTFAQPAFTNISGTATAAQIPTASTTLGGVKMASACGAGNHISSIVAGELTCTADSGGGGAPTTAGYWTTIADAGLSAEVAMGTLTSGLILNTTTTGVPTIYAGTSCTNQYPRSLNASGAATCAGVGVADFTANQGTTTQVLHGNAAGQPSWGAIVAGDLPTVTVAKGGSGLTTVAADQVYVGTAADTFTAKTLTNCTGASDAVSYNTTTHAWGCTTIAGGAPTFSGLTDRGVMFANGTTAIASSGNALVSTEGHINLVAASTPTTPSAGIGTLYGKQRAGRVIPTMIASDGSQQTGQEALFSNSIQFMGPNTGTTVPVVFGNTWTGRASTGTLSHPAIATTNHLTLMRQLLYTSGAVAGQGYGIQGTFAMNYLGNAANRGGFFFFCRFGFTAYTSAARVFVGLTTQNAAYAATEPSTVNNTVGLCKDSTDGTVAFCMRGTAVTKNGTWTPAANTVYDFTMSAGPNTTTVYYRLVDETNGTVIFDNLSTSTNAPAVNTLMYPWTWVGASSAVSQIMAVGKVYVASDY